jgi:hypothetical protein
LAIFSTWANKLPFYDFGGLVSYIDSPIANIRSNGPSQYFKIRAQKRTWSAYSGLGLKYAALPANMREKIGSQGVDIFPWETDIVAANNLTWQNRPSPFSFETYDPYLDNLNANFYNSSMAPPFIIWHNTGVNSIDYRYLLWDEPASFRSMLQNYDLVDSSEGFMLLQRREKPIHETQTVLSTQQNVAKGTWINVPSASRLDFASFKVQQSIGNKLVEEAVRADAYYITIKLKDGETIPYRFVKENSGQGFLVSDMPLSWNQLVNFMQNKGQSINSIKSFKVSANIKDLTFTQWQ